MGQDKNQLNKLLSFVNDLYDDPGNEEFAAGINAIVLNRLAITTDKDIKKIKEIFEIRADISIDYSFVKDISVRRQLMIDNLRMENTLLNLSNSEKERYENFCVNAFLQVENILNYYYSEKFGNDIDAFLSNIERFTEDEMYPFKRGQDKIYEYISEVSIYNKIAAFCKEFFPFDPNAKNYTFINLNTLRKIRNNCFHRANNNDSIANSESDKEKSSAPPTLTNFRDTLKRVAHKVKEELGK